MYTEPNAWNPVLKAALEHYFAGFGSPKVCAERAVEEATPDIPHIPSVERLTEAVTMVQGSVGSLDHVIDRSEPVWRQTMDLW